MRANHEGVKCRIRSTKVFLRPVMAYIRYLGPSSVRFAVSTRNEVRESPSVQLILTETRGERGQVVGCIHMVRHGSDGRWRRTHPCRSVFSRRQKQAGNGRETKARFCFQPKGGNGPKQMREQLPKEFIVTCPIPLPTAVMSNITSTSQCASTAGSIY
jgi:hypothetical protein